MFNARMTFTMLMGLPALLFLAAAPVSAQEVDQEKLEAAKQAAYDEYIPKELRDDERPEPIDVSNAATGHAAYIYGNTGPRPRVALTGPYWNHVSHHDYLYGYPFGNYSYNFDYSSKYGDVNDRYRGPYKPYFAGGLYHPSFHNTGFYALGDNYALPSVFQIPFDSRYRRSQPKLYKVRTHVPRHYVYRNGRYHHVRSHTRTEYVPLVKKRIRTRYNHGHHSIEIDYSN